MMAVKSSSLGLVAALYACSACGGRLDIKGVERGAGGQDAGGFIANGGTAGDVDFGSGGSVGYGGSAISYGGSALGGTTSNGGTTGAQDAGIGGAAAGHTPWTGNPSTCPASAPANRSACGAPEGSICGYYTKDPSSGYDVYSACACRAVTNTSLLWDCYDNAGGAIVCPPTEPANGSSCFGFKGSQCDYPPRTQCNCDANDPAPKWNCADPNPLLPGPPATIDGAKAVRDMSEADRRAFCEWYATGDLGPGYPAPPDVPPDADGTSGNTGCEFASGPTCNGYLPLRLPVSLCMGNLKLSTCSVPASELIDCAVTMFNQCWPSPRGCGPYLDSPGCSGTIVTKNGDGGPLGVGGAGSGVGGAGSGVGGAGSAGCRIRVQ